MKIMRGVDVSEIFSPDRVVKMAKAMGLTGGLSMDLRTGWDFRRREDRAAARKHVKEVQPLLLIGSPVCTPFSALQNWNWGRTRAQDERLRQSLAEATRHMEFVSELYSMQEEGGRYFLHENPASATSWSLGCIQRVMGLGKTVAVTGDQCEYGLLSCDSSGVAPAKKPTKFMTNSLAIAGELNVRCRGGHRHVHLVSGRAAAAAEYPDGLCEAICRGLARQKRWDREGRVAVNTLGFLGAVELEPKHDVNENHEVDGTRLFAGLEETGQETDENVNVEEWYAADDVTGEELDPRLVAEARRLDVAFFKDRGVYRKRRRATLPAGAVVVPVRWVDINKGSKASPDYRSRLVANQFRERKGSRRLVRGHAAPGGDAGGHKHQREPEGQERREDDADGE